MVEFACEAWCLSWTLFCWKIFYYWPNSLLEIGLFKFPMSSHFSFVRLDVYRNLCISFRLAYSFSWYSFIFVCISVVLVLISLLSFVILFIWVHSLFFLIIVARSLSIYWLFWKNQFLISLLCSIVLLLLLFIVVYIIYFCSNLYYLLPSAGYRFCLFFLLAPLGIKLGCLRFFLLLEVDLYCTKLSC